MAQFGFYRSFTVPKLASFFQAKIYIKFCIPNIDTTQPKSCYWTQPVVQYSVGQCKMGSSQLFSRLTHKYCEFSLCFFRITENSILKYVVDFYLKSTQKKSFFGKIIKC